MSENIDHLDIFNDLYAIKDKISDNDFLVLNNKIKKLIQENKELRKVKPLPGRVICINPSLVNGVIQYRYLSADESEDESEEVELIEVDTEDEDFPERDIPHLFTQTNILPQPMLHQCQCASKWLFSLTDRPEGELYDYFCLQSEQQMLNCENFKKFIEIMPLLENLFHKIDYPFVDEPIEQDYCRDQLIFTLRILMSINEQLSGKRRKSIITFVMYDLLIRTVNFLKSNQRFLETSIRKFNEFLLDDDYISLAGIYNVNIQKWKDIMTSLL